MQENTSLVILDNKTNVQNTDKKQKCFLMLKTKETTDILSFEFITILILKLYGDFFKVLAPDRS